MDVSRQTPDATTKPKWYDLANILVRSQSAGDDRSVICTPCGAAPRGAVVAPAVRRQKTAGDGAAERLFSWARFVPKLESPPASIVPARK